MEGLDKTDPSGKEYSYLVEEVQVKDFTSTRKGNDFVNEYTPEKQPPGKTPKKPPQEPPKNPPEKPPVTPGQPGQPGEPGKPDTPYTSLVKTGDETSIGNFILLSGLAASGMLVTIILKRRRRTKASGSK